MFKAISLAALVAAGLGAAPARAQAPSVMTFKLVRAEAPECGAECPEWIAAQGAIGLDTGKTFVEFLDKLDGRPRPVVIESPGGSVEAALEMGRAIREHKLAVGVAHTDVGWPIQPGQAPGRIAAISGPPTARTVFAGNLDADRSVCASACVFVLAAGVERFASPGALIGVHQMRISFGQPTTHETGIVLIRDAKPASEADVDPENWGVKLATTIGLVTENARVFGFFNEMGEDSGIVKIMQAASPEQMHFLTADEKSRTRVITAWLDKGHPVRTRFPDLGLALSPIDAARGAQAQLSVSQSWLLDPAVDKPLRFEAKLWTQPAAPGVGLTMTLSGAARGVLRFGSSADDAALNRSVAADGASVTEYLPAATFCAFAHDGAFTLRAPPPPTQAAGQIDPRAPAFVAAAAAMPGVPALTSALCPSTSTRS